MPMDPALKARWTSALRSGRYQQGQKRLFHQSNGTIHYCCLGVLCDLLIPNVHLAPFSEVEDEDETPTVFYNEIPLFRDDGDEKLADPEALGIADSQQNYLIDLNDGTTKYDPNSKTNIPTSPSQPFSVIADWIEANL